MNATVVNSTTHPTDSKAEQALLDALMMARDGYMSMRATGQPCLPGFVEQAISEINTATSKLAELQREVEAAKRGRAEDVRMLNYRIACQREEIRRLIRDREQGQKRFGTVFEVYHDGALVRTFDKFQDAYKHAESLYDLGRTTEVFQLFRLNCSWHNKFGMGVARQQEEERLSGGEGGGNG